MTIATNNCRPEASLTYLQPNIYFNYIDKSIYACVSTCTCIHVCMYVCLPVWNSKSHTFSVFDLIVLYVCVHVCGFYVIYWFILFVQNCVRIFIDLAAFTLSVYAYNMCIVSNTQLLIHLTEFLQL